MQGKTFLDDECLFTAQGAILTCVVFHVIYLVRLSVMSYTHLRVLPEWRVLDGIEYNYSSISNTNGICPERLLNGAHTVTSCSRGAKSN